MQTLTADQGGDRPAARRRAPIVGRHPQLEELSAALADAVAGRGALVLIAGDAGIGKTRLAETLADEASAGEATVVWGSAWDAGGAPAFWPWTQAIRALVSSRPADELREDLGAGAPYVAQIAPDVMRLLTPAESAPPLDNETTRFTAFDATASFLRAAAARRPIVLVLDDLHAADVATVRLLEFVARTLHGARILVVATCRLEPALDSDVATALDTLGNVAKRLVLGGLDRDQVRELAAEHACDMPAARLVERLHRVTEGNPLFVHEVLRLLSARGTLDAADALRLPIPRAVRETIRRRLAPLDPAAAETLRTAAVVGPEFRLETLARIAAADRPTLLAHLDAAIEAGLVRELTGAAGRYRFGHALVRETLYEDLSAQDRIARHAAVGEALAAIHGDRADASLSELAYHFLQAAPGGQALRAADYAERAGRQALESMAYEQAIELFRDALGALEDLACGPQRRGSLLLAMGQAEIGMGRLQAGRATLRAAADEARHAGDAELVARAALASAPWGLATAPSDEEGLVPILRQALEGLPPGDGALRARLLARLAAALYWSERAEQRRQLAEEAIAIARRLGDAATLAYVLSDAHRATWDPDSPRRSRPWVDEISALAERVGNVELALSARSWRISLLLELGRVADVDREIETFADAATRLHQQRAQVQSLLHRCARAALDGRFEDAERLLGQAGEAAADLQQDAILGMRIGALAFVIREAQGRLAELEPAVRMFAEAQPAMPVWRCGLLSVLLQSGRDDELRREYDRFAAGGFAIPVDNLMLPALALLSEACAHLGDADGARTLHGRLAPYSGRNVVTPDVAYIGPVDRYLALLAATAGDAEGAARYLSAARRLASSMGARPTSIRLDLDEARIIAAREPARAAALAAAATDNAAALGLDALAERARALAPVPPAAPPSVRGTCGLRRRGDMWEIGRPGTTFFLKDSLGLRHLAQLLAHPDRDFHVLELVAPAPAPERGAAGASDPELSLRGRGQDDLGPVLDERARADIRRRVGELESELAEAKAFNDPERASRARLELEALGDELSAKFGRAGRGRRQGADAERARISVTRVLGTAIARVEEKDGALGHHLQTCVKRGLYCRYVPGPGSTAWDVEP